MRVSMMKKPRSETMIIIGRRFILLRVLQEGVVYRFAGKRSRV